MSTLSLLSPLLITIFLISLTKTIFTSANPTNATLTKATDELIHTICSHTRNPTLCLHTLKPLKGTTLLPKPVSALGSRPVSIAQTQARKTHSMIWALHEKIKDNTRRPYQIKQKQRYYKCHVKFSDVMRRLSDAKMAMQEGDTKAVRGFAAVAMNQAAACEVEFTGPPREPAAVVKEIVAFRDVCSIILAVCDKLLANMI